MVIKYDGFVKSQKQLLRTFKNPKPDEFDELRNHQKWRIINGL